MRTRNGAGESGQILVMAALLMVVFLGIVGFAVDYGVMLLERQRLQNAVDAASLAGARALVDGATPSVASARTAALQYLELHGYRTDPTTTVAVSFPPPPPGSTNDSVEVQVSRVRPTYFVRVLGLEETTVGGQATASVDRRLVDVMLSLDLTGSMELSGTNDLRQLRDAVVDFVNQVNPDPTDPLGPQVGMARFAGVKCGWWRGANDLYIDLGPASEYRAPCSDDKTVLTKLTQDKSLLLKLADNTGFPSCPSAVRQYACPLVSWTYVASAMAGSPGFGDARPPVGLRLNGSPYGSGLRPDYTGTKLPNGVSVVFDPAGSGFDAWATANGGRNDPLGAGVAHKALVLMTDGFDELWPDVGHPLGSGAPAAWDTELVNRTNALKLGADGVAGTADDVEIYVVGFFCTPYSTSSGVPQKWCKSRLADTPAPHPCPGGVMPGTASAIDTLLRNASSSRPGSCDHYFPIKKTEDLPQLFRTIAGAIARGRLIE